MKIYLDNCCIDLNDAIITRAREIMKQINVKAFDSLHLASAETCADVLLTTDIKFLKACQRINLGIKVKNPINFVMEVEENGRNN